MDIGATYSVNAALRTLDTTRVGAWTLDYGVLPDGRYAVDYFNAFNGARTRHYFTTSDAALAEYHNFGRGTL